MMQIETPAGLAELEKQAAVVIATNERRTTTQATCNGGSAERLNTYINFTDFKIRKA